jgi:hypothetical protein
MNPFYLTSLVFLVLAALGALDAGLIHLEILPPMAGIRWLRVHLITLGVITQAIFGLLPGLVASRRGLVKPSARTDTWLILTAGLIILLIAVPPINQMLMIFGGGLVLLAAIMLTQQLAAMGGDSASPGRKFYLAGLVYFFLGIFVGTGFWLGWNATLGMKSPIEVHIHANNWGLMSMVFAGLLFDLYTDITGRPLRWPDSDKRIFWLMLLGTLGLVLGPWFGSRALTAIGLILHLTGTIMLVLNIWLPLRGTPLLKKPGFLHLTTSYLWILAPILFAPFVLFQVPGVPGLRIEANAPQALIYGWVLQFGFAFVPYGLARVMGSEQPQLGGSYWSLIGIHIGSALLWAGIFLEAQTGLLHGLAYLIWTLALLPILAQMIRILRSGRRLQTAQS